MHYASMRQSSIPVQFLGSSSVSSVIAKVQEENVQTLLMALEEADEGDRIAMRWLGVLSKRSGRYRRWRRELCKLSEEDAAEICLSG